MKTANKFFIFPLLIISLTIGMALGGNLFNNPQTVANVLNLDEQEATIRAIENTKPAVVSVMIYDYETYTVIDLAKNTKQVKSERVLMGQGTGFLISSNGWILTNKHVVDVARTEKAEFIVILNDKRKYEAALIDRDPFNDLAILRILGKDFPHLDLAKSSDLPIGTTVMAIGNALGRYQNSVTKGIISGLGRTIVASDKDGNSVNLDNVIQTDAEINHGNSGGPLIDLHGKVIGVNVAIDESGSSIGFAIPADDIKPVIDSVIAYSHIVRPWLGIRYIMISPELVEERSLLRNNGALLIKSAEGEFAIAPGSPAEKAGLKEGDIIFEINGIAINENKSLLSVTQSYKPGDKLVIKIQRGKDIVTKIAILDEFKQ
ncbi:MAG: trypsin-like peptidase domain-containing protein [bacterium]